jgi:lysyl-tRNA synthetase class 2
MTYGRVLARDGALAVVRTARRDLRLADPPSEWRAGDIVEVDAQVRLRPYADGDYPAPGSEVARLPRSRLEALQARADAMAKVRAFFAARGFLEVDTPLLVRAPSLELHLDAVAAGDGWLITSPEYQMKRLLAAGLDRIWQACKCFRAGERGPHHASEFTILEWYRGQATLDVIVDDTERLVHVVCGGVARLGDRSIDTTPPWPRRSVREAVREWGGVEIAGDEPADQLVRNVRAAGIEVAEGTAWDDVFFALFLARVEPAIAALERPLILERWPVPLAALARRDPHDPRVALRFEAYVAGLELANAFDELVDPVEQRARFTADQAARRARGKPVHVVDERLLAALAEGLPPSAGIALGFDRLVMLATAAANIDQVLAFTADEL